MSDLDRKLDELIRKLYLLYEFEKPSNFPLKFNTSLSLLDKPIKEKTEMISNNVLRSSQIKTQTSIPGQIRYQKNMIRKNLENNYTYIPENQIFENYFLCLQYVSKKHSLESIINTFSWQEYELFVESALNHYGYHAFRTFRYTINKKRHEVDIIARDNHKILFIDAKHWSNRTVNMAALKKAAVAQKVRALHLIGDRGCTGKLLEKLNYTNQTKFTTFQIFPVILVSNKIQYFHIEEGVPILSISNFNHFLNDFPNLQSSFEPIEMKLVSFQK